MQGIYTCVDIKAAQLDGWQVLDWENFMIFEKWTDQFSHFYQHWYNIKAQERKGSAKYWAAKIVLLSSIGKFNTIPRDGNRNKKPSYIGWFCLSYTRLMHVQLKFMCKSVGARRILYGDTDSLFLDYDKIMMMKSKFPDYFNLRMVGS